MCWCAAVASIQSRSKMPFGLPVPMGRAAVERGLPLGIALELVLFFRWGGILRLHRSRQRCWLLEQTRGEFKPDFIVSLPRFGAVSNTLGVKCRQCME